MILSAGGQSLQGRSKPVANTVTARPRELPTASVAVLPVALYTAQANFKELSDSTKAALATEVLLARLQELLGKQLIPTDRVVRASWRAIPEAGPS